MSLTPVRQFNKHILNRLTGRLARLPLTPFALVRHVGRKSGKTYETPLIIQKVEGGFVIALTYGPEVDWFRNVKAAGGCTLIWHQREYQVGAPEVIEPEQGRAAYRQPFRFILKLVEQNDFVRMPLVAGV